MTLSIITRNTNVSITGRQPRGLSPAFSRASAAYQSDGRKVGVGMPRFETAGGRRGVLVEEGTVNLITNPAFVQGLDEWARNQDAALDHVVLEGKSWCKVTSNQVGSTPGVLSGWIPVSANATYTFSLTGFVGQGTTSVYAYVNGNVTSNVVWNRPSSRLGTSPSRKVEVFNTGDNTQLRVGALWSSVAIGDWFEATEVQLEAKPYATSFVDGARANEALQIPITGILTPAEGTVETYMSVPRHMNSTGLIRFTTGSYRYDVWADAGGLNLYNSAGKHLYSGYIARSNTWVHFVLRWSQKGEAMFVDGSKIAESLTNTARPPFSNVMELGRYSAAYYGNAIFAGLRLYHRSLTDQEIAAHAVGNIVARNCYHYPFNGDLWPAPGSLGAVVSPTMTTRSGQAEVVTRRGNVDIITRPGKLEVIGR